MKMRQKEEKRVFKYILSYNSRGKSRVTVCLSIGINSSVCHEVKIL
jgi:hypothetical protein